MNIMKAKVAYMLKELSIPPHLLGFDYLMTAVELAYEKPDIMHAVVKELYPTVAKMHNTTGSRAERAIRQAILWSFDNCIEDIVYAVFGNTVESDTGKVTNAHFVATLVEILKYEPDHPIFKGSRFELKEVS